MDLQTPHQHEEAAFFCRLEQAPRSSGNPNSRLPELRGACSSLLLYRLKTHSDRSARKPTLKMV